MEFENASGLTARLFRGEPEPRLMLAVVVVKAAYEVGADGTLAPALRPDAACVLHEPVPTPLGLLPSDQVPYRQGVNLFVHAQAYAPGGRPTTEMTASLRLGAGAHELLVVGDRVWTREGRPTAPRPFVTMPLTYARAYGGVCAYRGRQVASPDNPDGRGFVCEVETLEGTPLPNVEDPRRRISTWQDRPRPMSWAPLPEQSALHLNRAVEVLDAASLAYRFRPQVFDCAHPDLVLAELPPRTRGTLHGVSPDGVFAFEVPQLRLTADLELGARRFRFEPRLDTLGILVEERRIVATWRTSFRYRLVDKEVRRLSLRRAGEETAS